MDGVICYKTDNLYKEIKKVCPRGIDAYFDCVGKIYYNTFFVLLKKK